MKLLTLCLCVVFVFSRFAFCEEDAGQDLSTDLNSDSSSAITQSETTDSGTDSIQIDQASTVNEKKSSTEEFDNPFSTGDDSSSAITEEFGESDTPQNPFTVTDESISGVEEVPANLDESEQSQIDFLIDLTVGLNFSRLEVEPVSISTEGESDFTFGLGVLIPFPRHLYAKASVRYNRIRFRTANSDSIPSLTEIHYSKETTEELLIYVSLGIDVGMRFKLGPLVPYFYAELQPAVLTSSGRSTVMETYYMNASDSADITFIAAVDRETTRDRERIMLFAGGGVGLEISYGYGAFYIDGAIQLALKDPGHKNSSPIRTSSKLMFFPVTMGIRFYL